MMSSTTLIELIRGWLPFSATGASTLRGYLPGTLLALRKHLAKVTLDDLRGFAVNDENEFRERLNYHTIQLAEQFLDGPNWGAARKVLNIYLRSVLYNQYIRASIPFHLCESYLEVPLDSFVAKSLRSDPNGSKLPRWKNLISLDFKASNEYQSVASVIAAEKELHRIHLDLIFGPDKL